MLGRSGGGMKCLKRGKAPDYEQDIDVQGWKFGGDDVANGECGDEE